jgi:hypothetical protein
MSQSQLVITKLLMTETGTYNPMYLRPYKSNLDVQTVQAFAEATNNGTLINANALTTIAGNVLSPQAQIHGSTHIPIAGGWDGKRFRFLMEVERIDSFNQSSKLIQIVGGYTDHLGASALTGTVHIDPAMMFYINSVTTVRQMLRPTAMGLVPQSNVTDSSQILYGKYNPGFGQANQIHQLMRPMDVLAAIGRAPLPFNADVIDTRNSFANGPQKSRRSNNLAPSYLAETMNALTQAYHESNSETESIDNIMGRAMKKTKEGLTAEDSFLSTLQRNSQIGHNQAVQYHELCSISPGLDDRTAVVFNQGASLRQVSTAGQTETWHGAGNETVAATILAQAVPAIMMDLMLTQIAIMATNQTHGGAYDVRVLHAASFSDHVDLGPYCATLIDRVRHEVLQSLTRNNQIEVMFTMQVDILGETSIQISMNGGPTTPFVVPSFCDGRFVPTIALDQMPVASLAHDIDQLKDQLSVDYGVRNDYAPGAPINPTYGNTIPNNTGVRYNGV